MFHDFKTGEQDMDIKSGYLRGMETHGLKVIDWTAVNEARGLPALVGLIMLFDTETGVPLGVLDGSYITGVRTGCAGAIGAKYLTRRDSRSLFVLGTGGQASFQTAAFLYAFPQLRRVYVADPRHGEKAELFVSTIRERLRTGFNIDASGVGFIAAAADAMGEAVGSSDMIVTTTPSHSPIVKAGWIKSGTHLSCIGADMSGKQEIESTIFRNAVIIVPEPTPQAKVDKIRFYGGKVLLMGRDHDEAHRLGMKYIAENDLTYIDAYYDDPKIYGGQGTIALEILEQDPEIDTIVCPIGGGGLITGIAVAAKAVKPNIRIIGVQTEACPAMIAALRDHVFYDEYPITGDTICDALVGGVGALSYAILGDYVDDIIEVKESSIRAAVKHMVLNEKFIVEGGSATTVAAVMDYPERVGGKNVALVMSGGNIDGVLLQSILNG